MSAFLEITRGSAPLLVCFPHTGGELPPALEARMTSGWLARKDADHWVHLLYDFASALGASTLRTTLSRSVIDVNRDPAGVALYPGRVNTELCPLSTFDGEALYLGGQAPAAAEIAERRVRYFAAYHAALAAEIERLGSLHGRVVVYDAHSIRSHIPRLFDGTLPELNLGTYDGASCAPALAGELERVCAHSGFSHVTNGRFKGGWTTRHYGRPQQGVHALQMELACRAYLDEPTGPLGPDNWPPPYEPARAAALRTVLHTLLERCIQFAVSHEGRDP